VTITLTVRPRPDVIGQPRVNDGTQQRSMTTSLDVSFDAALDTALLQQPGAFTVRRVADDAVVGTVTVTAVAVTVTAARRRPG
jgi:hypothetical protein